MVGRLPALARLAGLQQDRQVAGGLGHGTAFRASHLLLVVLQGAWWR